MLTKRPNLLQKIYLTLFLAALILSAKQLARIDKIPSNSISAGVKQEQSAASIIQPDVYPGARKLCHTLSPESIIISQDGATIYIAERTHRQILGLNLSIHKIVNALSLPGDPTGLVLSPHGEWLYVTCVGKENALLAIGLPDMAIRKTLAIGAGACSPIISPDGGALYVLNRFANQLLVINLTEERIVQQIDVGREPISAALNPDGSLLVVVNHLPEGSSDFHLSPAGSRLFHTQGAAIRLFETKEMKSIAEFNLPAGSTNIRDVCISPDGRYAFVTHILAHFQRPTDRLELGWINKNAFTVIDLPKQKILASVLFDSPNRGAANPWGIACSKDGRYLLAAHAGTHEVSVIDLPRLINRLERMPENERLRMPEYQSPYRGYGILATTKDNVSRDLTFLNKLRRRIPLQGLGPRKIAVWGNRVYLTDYFSSGVEFFDFEENGETKSQLIQLGTADEPTEERWGEFLFHDASICYQGWQSCSSCHPDGRSDALNWDLLNDGIGNPKNTKSLLLSHKTPPAMFSGIRADAETAVRSGLRYILFASRPEEEARAIDAYLKALQPYSGALRNNEKLSPAAKRGKILFFSQATGCVRCHSGPYYTDLRMYDVGTQDPIDKRNQFDTPSLIEVWRTAPYLHDGRASTLEETFTQYNPHNLHGRTSQLSQDQMSDLVEFLISL